MAVTPIQPRGRLCGEDFPLSGSEAALLAPVFAGTYDLGAAA